MQLDCHQLEPSSRKVAKRRSAGVARVTLARPKSLTADGYRIKVPEETAERTAATSFSSDVPSISGCQVVEPR